MFSFYNWLSLILAERHKWYCFAMASGRKHMSEDVKRAVRQRCGFGCVVCGLGYYDYHHVIPYSVSHTHDPDEIVLLCSYHHTQYERGRMSKQVLSEHSSSPKAVLQGFANGTFESSPKPLLVDVGTNIIEETPNIVTICNIPMFGFSRPKYEDEPIGLTAFMSDVHGNPLFTIKNNNWVTHSKVWDITTEGQTIAIRNGARSLGLKMRFIPAERIIVERASIRFLGVSIEILEDRMVIDSNIISNSYCKRSNTAFAFNSQIDTSNSKPTWLRNAGSLAGINMEPQPHENIKFGY
jgi:hypothetical protein